MMSSGSFKPVLHVAALSALLCLLPATALAQTAAEPCSPQVSSTCAEMNRELTEIYRSSRSRLRGGGIGLPAEVRRGIEALQHNDIALYDSMLTLANRENEAQMREAILQEHLRSQSLDGMSWLPLSWTLVHRNIESEYIALARQLEISLRRLPRPWSDDQMLSAVLFTSTVPHSNFGNRVQELRMAAAVLAFRDPRFWETRVEIHQEPSLRTLEKVNEYIRAHAGAGADPETVRVANQVKTLLEQLFGPGDIESYLESFALSAEDQALLRSVAASLTTINGIKTSAELVEKMGAAFSALRNLGARAREVSASIRTEEPTPCSQDRLLNCVYEKVDFLRQLQTSVYALGGVLLDKLVQHQISISAGDFIELTGAYIASNISVGLMNSDALGVLDEFAKRSQINTNDLNDLIRDLDVFVQGMAQNVRGPYIPLLAKYRPFVPGVDRFIDDVLRSSSVLPMSNLLAAMKLAIQRKNGGIEFWINGSSHSGSFQVLNPGMARGKLIIADPEAVMSEDYRWDPAAIYVLAKTPAELHKVSGILTADSGSMISHVQLLAANHGIPNIFLSPQMIEKLKPLDGRDVLLTALPNGEAHITPWNKISRKELNTYGVYMNARQKVKVTLKTPEGLSRYNKPMFLHQLRIGHSGVIAGGKACGQGELAGVFPNSVPHGIVLPFGVYYDHVVKTGIYSEIQETFSNPAISNDPDRRREALARIRERIQNIGFSSEVRDFLRRELTKSPYVDRRGYPRGVFVRSDTNAEDLPEFVGAGLNQTVVNAIGLEKILEAVKTVWASPFREKSFTWREDLISNPWDIFPSVIIQLGVNSEKAGVMVVGDTRTDDIEDAVIIAANEGLGITVVNGEYTPEESVYSRSTGKIKRLRRAYAPTRKTLSRFGGIDEIPTSGGASIMSDAELATLANAGDVIQKHIHEVYGEMGKWDLEWGWSQGRMILFQIRPFIGNKIAKNVGSLNQLRRGKQVEISPVTLVRREFVLPSHRE